MNIFEDLIEELKEENLLEDTVLETKKKNQPPKPKENIEAFPVKADNFVLNEEVENTQNQPVRNEFNEFNDAASEVPGSDEDIFQVSSSNIFAYPVESVDIESIDSEISAEKVVEEDIEEEQFVIENEYSFVESDFEVDSSILESEHLTEKPQSIFEQQEHFFQPAEAAKPNNEKEFYRKRAMEEVSGLQMVEHVISGVEREQMKVAPKPYDDLGVKKALHQFMQVSEDVNSGEHAQAEYQLMQETQNWCSALSHRDRRISVAHLRRFCETTRPVLSSQALLALARFYRNLPYSESVRSKFDLVITRLFTREIGKERRELVFTKEEMHKHLKDLYAEWESIQLYSDDKENQEVVGAISKFKDFVAEAEKALNFDELVNNDFFNRLRIFKEGTNELFFAPQVATSAIDCNIRIGNQYVELIERERRRANSDQLQDKYGFLHDQAISDAASKTLQLVDLLKEISESDQEDEDDTDKTILISAESLKALQTELAIQKDKKTNPLGVNNWLAAVFVLVCLACGSLYVWVEYFSEQVKTSDDVAIVDLNDGYYHEYLQTARISEETYYGVTLPAWDLLELEKREEILKNILAEGANKGYRKVKLIDKKARTVGDASAQGIVVQTAPE